MTWKGYLIFVEVFNREFYTLMMQITDPYVFWSIIQMERLLWKLLENFLQKSLNREDLDPDWWYMWHGDEKRRVCMRKRSNMQTAKWKIEIGSKVSESVKLSLSIESDLIIVVEGEEKYY